MFKEFFTSLCREVFDTDRGLWLANTKRELYPNPHAYATEREFFLSWKKSAAINDSTIPRSLAHSLNWYRFIGRILGKAMYEGILVDVAFAGFFLAKVRSSSCHIDDVDTKVPFREIVVRSSVLPRRSLLAGPRAIQGSHISQTL